MVTALVAGGVAWLAWPASSSAAAIGGTVVVTGCTPTAVQLTATPFEFPTAPAPAPTTPTVPATSASTSTASTTSTTEPTAPTDTAATTSTNPSTTVRTRPTVAPTTTVFLGPIIVSVSPPSAAIGSPVTISGHGFGTDPAVRFGATPAPGVRAHSDASIVVVVPPGAGTVDITVTAGGIDSRPSTADQFAYPSSGFGSTNGRDLHSLVAPRAVKAAPAPSGAPLTASVHSTGDGHYAFEVPKAKTHRPYRLAMDLGPGCKGAHVHGPAGGMVIGGGLPLIITADLPGALQVYAGSPSFITVDGQLRNNWNITDALWPFAPNGGTRIFHWATGAAGTAVGQWQVATQPLGDACTAAAGLVASGVAPFASGALTPSSTATDFSIDFKKIADALAIPVNGFPEGEGPIVYPGAIPGNGGSSGTGGTGGSQPAGLGSKVLGGSNPVQPTPTPTPFTGTFYVRVLPLDGAAKCTGVATPPVTITWGVPGSTPLGTSTLQVDTGTATFDSSFNVTAWSWGTSLAFEWNQQPATFRWTSTAPGTSTGEWQVSTEPFVQQCADSPGLKFTGTAGYATGPFVNSGNGAADLQDAHVFSIDFPSIVEKGALTLYVRVVPRGANPKACTGPATNTVRLDFQPPGKGGLITTPPTPPPPPTGALNVSLVQYQPFHFLDPDVPFAKWCFVAISDHTTSGDFFKEPDIIGLLANSAGLTQLKAGQSFCLTPPGPPDPSFLDQVVQFVEDVVSFPAQVYALYKTVLPNVIGSFLTDVLHIPGCAPPENSQPPGKCFAALNTAEDIGLAALGLPPSLPDLKSLLNNGIDELAGEAASELDGVGVQVQKEQIAGALNAAKDEIVQQFATVANQAQGFDCSVNGVTWCAFDGGARAPSVTLTVSRPANSTLAPAKNVCVDIAPSTLYTRSCTTLPALAPGASTTVRIALRTTVATLSPSSKYAMLWMKDYDACNSTQLQPDEGCTKATDRAVQQTWQGDATNGSIPQLTISAVTSPAPTEAGSVWSVSVVSTVGGCGGNGSPPPEAAATKCPT